MRLLIHAGIKVNPCHLTGPSQARKGLISPRLIFTVPVWQRVDWGNRMTGDGRVAFVDKFTMWKTEWGQSYHCPSDNDATPKSMGEHSTLTHRPVGDLHKISDKYFFNRMIHGWGSSCRNTIRSILLKFTDYMSTLAQERARCHQATSHYLSQCWPRSMSPFGITGPQQGRTSQHNRVHISSHALYLFHCCLL